MPGPVSCASAAPAECRGGFAPGSAIFATPKSSTFARPSRVTKMFAGLMSRWMMPRWCAASSASATCDADVEQAVERQRIVRDAAIERLAVEQLHRDEVLAVRFFDRVDRADVRMIERARRPRLALEPLERRPVARQLRRQELQRDASSELRVLGLIDDAHPAAAESTGDGVVENGFSDQDLETKPRTFGFVPQSGARGPGST